MSPKIGRQRESPSSFPRGKNQSVALGVLLTNCPGRFIPWSATRPIRARPNRGGFMRYSLLAAALAVTAAAPGSAQSPHGVWKTVEAMVSGGPNAGRHTSDVQPSLLLIAGRHYSMIFVQGFTSRPQFGENPSAEEQAKVWGPFTANAGTYRIKDSTFSFTPIVAKNPSVMSGRTLTAGFRIRADSMWLTNKDPDGVETRTKWVRIDR
jgi:hypothetical protein